MSTQLTIGDPNLKSLHQRPIYQNLMNYKNDTKKCDKNLFKLTISCVATRFKIAEQAAEAKITHLLDVFDEDSEEWDIEPGLPWCENGYKTNRDIRNDPKAVQAVRKFWHLLKDGEDVEFPDCMVHTGPAGETVWTYPAAVVFGEEAFVRELIKAYTEKRLIAYDYLTDPNGGERLYKRFHRNNKFYVKLEFNESSIPNWLIEYAFLIHVQNINFAQYSIRGVPDVRKMYRMINHIQNYFVNTPIRLPDGTRVFKRHGLPSGSRFTKLIASVISAIIVQFLSFHIDGAEPEDGVVLGQESLTRISSYWNLNECKKILMRDFGITLKPNCQISKNLKQIRFAGYKRIYFK